MSDEITRKSLNVTAPVLGEVLAIAVTSTAGAVSLASYVGRWVTLQADGAKVYILMAASSDAADNLDNTATSGDTRCAVISDGLEKSFVVQAGTPYLGYKTASGSTATLRIHTSSTRSGS
jgi:hypothetical protein